MAPKPESSGSFCRSGLGTARFGVLRQVLLTYISNAILLGGIMSYVGIRRGVRRSWGDGVFTACEGEREHG